MKVRTAYFCSICTITNFFGDETVRIFTYQTLESRQLEIASVIIFIGFGQDHIVNYMNLTLSTIEIISRNVM